MKFLKAILSTMVAAFLSACGGGGREKDAFYPPVPDGIPVIVGGFIGWTDVQTTPDGGIGIVNGTGNPIVCVTFTDTKGDDTFWPTIAPGATWSSTEHPAPGFYLVTAYGSDDRVFKRYFLFQPDVGSDAAVVSNANWWVE